MKIKLDLNGSAGTAALFLLTLLSALVSLAESYTYRYKFYPKVQFFIDRKPYATVDGDYVAYGGSKDLSKQLLELVEDSSFGCTQTNETDTILYRVNSVFLLPDTSDHCSGFEKMQYVSNAYNAAGVIFYRTPGDNDKAPKNTTPIDRQRRQTQTRTPSSNSGSPTVVRLSLLSEQLLEFRSKLRTGSTLQVTIQAEVQQRTFQTSQTFYFVVFAFCILMMLSCSWLLLSYFKRCHYRWRMRRNQVRSANETRQMVNRLPTKSYKSSKEKGEVPTCVVCLETFKNHDSIRILPCKHEFHKKCIDPWLKIKRNCPMCKQDIFPKRRSNSSRGGRSNSEAGGQRRSTRATHSDHEMIAVLTAADLSERQRTRSWSSSSSSNSDMDDNSSSASSNVASNSTQETDTSTTLLLDDATNEAAGSIEDNVHSGVTTMIVVRPAATVEDEVPQQSGDREMTVLEMETVLPVVGPTAEVQVRREEGEQRGGGGGERDNLSSSASLSEQVGVDIEGLTLLEAAPVVNA